MRLQFFPSFFQSPGKIKFDRQEESENIVLFLRQHPIVNIFWVSTVFLLIVMPAILIFVDELLGLGYLLQIPINLFVGGLIIYYLLILAYGFEQFLSWYFNVYIVTNMHIVDINFYSLLAKEVVEISLDDIEVIASHTAGILGSLFNFGTVEIETAAETKRIHFEKVPRPDLVSDTVQDLQRIRKTMGGGKHH